MAELLPESSFSAYMTDTKLSRFRPVAHACTGQKAHNHADSRPTLSHRVYGIYLTAPLHAQARTQVQTRLSSRLQPHLMGPLYRDAMEMLARADRHPWQAGHPLYDGLQSLRQVVG